MYIWQLWTKQKLTQNDRFDDADDIKKHSARSALLRVRVRLICCFFPSSSFAQSPKLIILINLRIKYSEIPTVAFPCNSSGVLVKLNYSARFSRRSRLSALHQNQNRSIKILIRKKPTNNPQRFVWTFKLPEIPTPKRVSNCFRLALWYDLVQSESIRISTQQKWYIPLAWRTAASYETKKRNKVYMVHLSSWGIILLNYAKTWVSIVCIGPGQRGSP